MEWRSLSWPPRATFKWGLGACRERRSVALVGLVTWILPYIFLQRIQGTVVCPLQSYNSQQLLANQRSHSTLFVLAGKNLQPILKEKVSLNYFNPITRDYHCLPAFVDACQIIKFNKTLQLFGYASHIMRRWKWKCKSLASDWCV